MQIHIQKGEGITHGIKRALEASGTDTSKINDSIWSQVMQEVSTENSSREDNNKIYEGGSNLQGNYKDNFVVRLAKGTSEKIIELAQATWNKIVSLLTGNAESVAKPVAEPVTEPVTAPATEPATEPASATEPELASKPIVPNDNSRKKLTEEQLKQKVDNLKPGESFTYQRTISGQGYIEKSSVKYIRNKDGTLSLVTYELNDKKIIPLTTTYSQDGKRKSSQAISTKYQGAIVTSECGDDGNVSSKTTDLSNFQTTGSSLQYRLVEGLPKNRKATEQTVKSKDGQILVTYKNGQFYNAKGKVINDYKAYKILEKANNKNEITQLVEQY